MTEDKTSKFMILTLLST